MQQITYLMSAITNQNVNNNRQNGQRYNNKGGNLLILNPKAKEGWGHALLGMQWYQTWVE